MRSSSLRAAVVLQPDELLQAGRGDQVDRSFVEVRDVLLAGEGDRAADVLGERVVDRGVVAAQHPAVREADDRDVAIVARHEVEQTRHPTEAPGRLAAAELAVGVVRG